MAAIRERVSRCFAQRGNVENLLVLAMITVIEIAIALEAPYYLLAIVVTLVIFMKEFTILLLFAEEVEREIRVVAHEVADEVRQVADAATPEKEIAS